MKSFMPRGSAVIFLVVGVALIGGASFLVKDEQGVSYGQKGYNMVHYFLFDRGQQALEKAKDAKNSMQNHEDSLNIELKNQ